MTLRAVIHRHRRTFHDWYAFGVRQDRCVCGHTFPAVWPEDG